MRTLSAVMVGLMVMAGAASASAQVQGPEISVTVQGHVGVVKGSPSDNFLSFSAPVGVPGVALAPGTYIFRVVAPSIMQVLSENRSTTYAMFMVQAASRGTATKDYAVTLVRVRDDAPARITKIFLPNLLEGYEIPYPKTELAKPTALAMK
jgi:hypothetical protein